MCLHEAEDLIKEAEKHGGRESKSAAEIYLEALASYSRGLENAEDAEGNILMEA